jgi:hypothetical protein
MTRRRGGKTEIGSEGSRSEKMVSTSFLSLQRMVPSELLCFAELMQPFFVAAKVF